MAKEDNLTNKGKGRVAGVPNKATKNAREAIGAFVDSKTDLLDELLADILKNQGSLAAWGCIMDLIEYHVPKLARTEITGKDGGQLNITISPVDAEL